MDSVSLGDIAGMIAALAFAFLVFRLGSVIGKAGKILDETRISLRSTTENVQPTLLKLTDTVSLTNEQLARVDGITSNRPDLLAELVSEPQAAPATTS